MDPLRPIRVALVNDYEIVVAGVAALLAPHHDRVQVVEMVVGAPPAHGAVDVVLYDTFGQAQADHVVVEDLIPPGSTAKVVIYSWNLQETLLDRARSAGVAGYVSKSATAEELVATLERVHGGDQVFAEADPGTPTAELGRWPGQDVGLTARESEILALICQGLSNEEICGRAFVAMNTVKTHVRHVYRKLGVARRSQAVAWGLQHGFEPDREAGDRG